MLLWRADKVANEVRFIEYLRKHTTISLPCIRCWGSQLDLFIILDFIERIHLSIFLIQPWKTGRFWFSYAARTCLDIDDIIWNALHFDLLDELARVVME